jgi:large subunit ribosomal protein L28
MSAHCQVTGRKPGFGKSVSHSHVRTNRRWDPNIQRKTYFLPSEGRRITLRVSAKGIKTIDRDGIEAVVARIRGHGGSDGTGGGSPRNHEGTRGRRRKHSEKV